MGVYSLIVEANHDGPCTKAHPSNKAIIQSGTQDDTTTMSTHNEATRDSIDSMREQFDDRANVEVQHRGGNHVAVKLTGSDTFVNEWGIESLQEHGKLNGIHQLNGNTHINLVIDQ